MDYLEEMQKFLERYKLSRLNQEEIENMNRPTTGTEIEIDFKTSNNKKNVQDQMVSQANSIKHLEKSEHLSSWNFQKLQRKEAHFTITLKPKLDNIPPKKKKNYRPVSLMNKMQNPQNTSKLNPTTH